MSTNGTAESSGLDKEMVHLLRRICKLITKEMYKINEFANKSGVDERIMREFLRDDEKQRRRIDPANFLKPLTEFVVNSIPIEYLDSELARMIKELHAIRASRYVHNTSLHSALVDVFGSNFDLSSSFPKEFLGKYIGYRYTYQAEDIVRLGMEISVDSLLEIPSFTNYFVGRQKTMRVTRGFGCYIREQLYLFGHVDTGAAIKSFVLEKSFEGPRCLPGLVLTFGPNGRPFASKILLVPLEAHRSVAFEQSKYSEWIRSEEFGNVPLGVFPVVDVRREWDLLSLDGAKFSHMEEMLSNKVEEIAVLRLR